MEEILFEAKSRWFRPSEVCEILRNYRRLNFNITPDPPYLPSGGSLYFFDRKALRYFRKDGHHWKKKKDGKTVREAHEKLKSGSVDVLHCYYAHGEENESFQRRCYWLLDGKLEHIVLVHYRDVNEETSSSSPLLVGSDPTLQTAQTSPGGGTSHINSTTFDPVSFVLSFSNVEWITQSESSEFEDADCDDDPSVFPLAESVADSGVQAPSLPGNSITESISVFTGSFFHPYTVSSMNAVSLNGSVNPVFSSRVTSQNLTLNNEGNVHGTSPDASILKGLSYYNSPSTWSESTWSEFHSLKPNPTDTQEQNFSFLQLNYADALSKRRRDSTAQSDEMNNFELDGGFYVMPEPYSQLLTADDFIQDEEENAEVADHPVDKDSTSNDSKQTFNKSSSPDYQLDLAPPSDSNEHVKEVPSVLKSSLGADTDDNEPADSESYGSFEKWMNEKLGNECNDSLTASNPFSYWNSIDTPNDTVFSTMSQHIQFDSLAPSLSEEQLFSINDFSPDWAYSGSETKVLISGAFLGVAQPSSINWCCMFGEVEVSAEVLATNAIRCQAPIHNPGRVPFYITSSNRLACSEVREFEYREDPAGAAISESPKTESKDEIYLQIRLAKMLSIESDVEGLFCSIENCAKCVVKQSLVHMLIEDEPGWEKIEKGIKTCEGYLWILRDALLEKLLKGRLYEWLVCKLHEDGKGPSILDGKGHGAVHLAAALGYEWAVTSIVAAGVSPSFRDARGRTALHWAAYYGRERTIVTLLELGASPGAIEDPTSKFPVGRTAADIASSSGHKGIAAYLAEADLISHLNSMSLTTENVMNSVSASLAAEVAVETLEIQNNFFSDAEAGKISLRESLAAVRNSAQAAARIHSAFRAQSLRQRQLTRDARRSAIDIACGVMSHPSASNKIHKIGRFNGYLHASAIKIQKKYRGWKIRKKFLKIRDRIVKIQAHVRGHQVRKQNKNIVWSVGIVEKAILRWRRKGSGLRGFRAEKAIAGGGREVQMADEYDFLRVGRRQKAAGVEKALARVKSMVRCPEAREQYGRLMARSKVLSVNSSSDQADSLNEENLMENGAD